jgi:hypothetical protein
MANLGKFVTAAGCAVVLVFSIIGLIVVAATSTTEYGPGLALGVMVTGGLKAVAIIEGVLLVVVSGAAAASGFVPALAKCPVGSKSPWALVLLVVVTVLPFKLFMMVGALAAAAGGCWASCCSTPSEVAAPQVETKP